MEKTAIIYCGGSGTRWSSKGYPKQLHVIMGSPILHRTVGQFKARGVTVKILARDERLEVKGCDVIRPDWDRRWLSEDIEKSAPHWQGRMIGAFGDVIWTEEAMDTLCSANGFRFLGREDWSVITGGCPELFGWVWGEEDNDKLLEAMRAGVAHAMAKSPDGAVYDYMTGAIWQPYRWLCNLPIDLHCAVDEKHWLRVDDLTDDIDTPEAGMRITNVWERHNGVTPKLTW